MLAALGLTCCLLAACDGVASRQAAPAAGGSSEASAETAAANSTGPAPQPGRPAAEPYALPRTEVRQLTSTVNGVDYKLYVSLPRDYAERTGERFPVAVLLDADYSFALAHNIVEHLSDRDHLRELILVGVAYGGPPAYRIHRTRDYTPVYSADGYPGGVQKVSGGAPSFRRALAEELLPWIERRYRTLPGERALVGHSYGGLFTVYVLLTQPELFSSYIAVSPSLWYADGWIFGTEEETAAGRDDLAAKLYLTVGAREGNGRRDMQGTMETLEERLRSRRYPGLTVTRRVLPDETHNSVFPAALSNGLRWAFDGR